MSHIHRSVAACLAVTAALAAAPVAASAADGLDLQSAGELVWPGDGLSGDPSGGPTLPAEEPAEPVGGALGDGPPAPEEPFDDGEDGPAEGIAQPPGQRAPVMPRAPAPPPARASQTINAASVPINENYSVPSMPAVGDVLVIDVSGPRDAKLRDLFSSTIEGRRNTVARGEPVTNVVARWRVVEVGADGKVRIKLVRSITTYDRRYIWSDYPVDSLAYGDGPEFVIALQTP